MICTNSTIQSKNQEMYPFSEVKLGAKMYCIYSLFSLKILNFQAESKNDRRNLWKWMTNQTIIFIPIYLFN